MKIRFWNNEIKIGKRMVRKNEEIPAVDNQLESFNNFLDAECKHKCYLCPACIVKLEKLVIQNHPKVVKEIAEVLKGKRKR